MRSKGKQIITLWAKSGTNAYSEPTYSAPVTFVGRWEERTELVRTPSGEDITSRAIVYLPMSGLPAVAAGDKVALGDQDAFATPDLVAGAEEVQVVFEIPSLRTNQMETRLVL